MKKYLVESINGAYLHDMFGGQGVNAHRPCVVSATPFIENMRGSKLKVLAELADDASDDILAAAKTDEELAEAIELLKPTPRKKA